MDQTIRFSEIRRHRVLLDRDLPSVYEESWNEGTVVQYQPDETLNLEVKVDSETDVRDN